MKERLLTADDWITHLAMKPHPEGGWFREVYRSAETIPAGALPPRFPREAHRSTATSIYYLLEGEQTSAFHRIRSDEIWHHYDGGTVLLHQLSKSSRYGCSRIGHCVDRGDVLQEVVPAGDWFGAELAEADSWALMGCTVSPGFDFADFEMGSRAILLENFSDHCELIVRLTSEASTD